MSFGVIDNLLKNQMNFRNLLITVYNIETPLKLQFI